MKDLAYRTALPVRSGLDFDTDIARLMQTLDNIAGRADD